MVGSASDQVLAERKLMNAFIDSGDRLSRAPTVFDHDEHTCNVEPIAVALRALV